MCTLYVFYSLSLGRPYLSDIGAQIADLHMQAADATPYLA